MNNLQINDAQALACRKHCLPTLRKLDLKSPLEFAPHGLEWSVLNESRSTIMRAANELLTRAEGKEGDEAAGMEAAHAALTAMYDATENEKDARAKLGDRSPRAHGGDVRRPIGADVTHQEHRVGGDAWRDLKSGREVRVLKPSESVESAVRETQSGDSLDGLGIGGFVRAAVMGPKNDAEKRALGESLGTSGGYGVPVLLASRVIDTMRRQSVVFKAGAGTVVMESNQLDIARLNADPVVSWRGENQQIGESDPTFGKVTFYAKNSACLVKLSRELMEDAANIDAAVNNALGQAMALDLDRVALIGAGGLEPLGVRNFGDRNTVDLGGNGVALAGYDDLLDAHYELDLDHVPEDGRMAVMHPRTRRDYSKAKDGDGSPLVKPDRVQGMSFLSSTAVPIDDAQGSSNNATRVYLGYWPHLLIGIRTELMITILRERYADFGQFALLAWLRADVNAEHDQSFCDVAGILPSI